MRLADIAKPTPKNREVLVKIHASSVTAEDPKMRGFNHAPLLKLPIGLLFGFRKPRKPIPGMEFSGVVESVGPNVREYQPGDQVFGYTGLSFGAHAEYKCMPERGLMAFKPQNVSFEQAAILVNGPLSALVYLKKKGRIKAGDRVLVYGASGSVGSAAVQLACYFGATVSGVCSTKNAELVTSLGATHVIDYTREDITKIRDRYDIVFDTVGKLDRKQGMRLLTNKGKYLATEFGLSDMLAAVWSSVFGRKKVIVAASNFYWKREDLTFLATLVEKGLFQPVLDRCFSLEQIAEAHTYVESGRKSGNVAILIQ